MSDRLGSAIRAAIANDLDTAIDDVSRACEFRSTRDNEAETQLCAEWLAHRLHRAGFHVQLLSTPGANPVVHATQSGRTSARLLFINHYDVEVPGNEQAWTSPPFLPTIRDESLFARGSADNKGNLIARLAAVEALRSALGVLPCSVTFAIDAKRSLYANHFAEVIAARPDLFSADAVLWENALNHVDGRPTLRLGDKGICMVELGLQDEGPSVSSQYAALLPGAAWRLVWILSALRPNGSVPHWLSSGTELSSDEIRLISDLPVDGAAQSVARLVPGLALEEILVGVRDRPSCNLSSLHAGNPQGLNVPLTAIPTRAIAQLDLRVLPSENPIRVFERMKLEIARHDPGATLELLGSLRGQQTRLDHPFVAALQEAALVVWRDGARIEPLSAAAGARWSIAEHSPEVPIVGTGVAYAGSRIAGLDEHIRIDDLRSGIEFMAAALMRMGSEIV